LPIKQDGRLLNESAVFCCDSLWVFSPAPSGSCQRIGLRLPLDKIRGLLIDLPLERRYEFVALCHWARSIARSWPASRNAARRP
jgi:hypothetical protein